MKIPKKRFLTIFFSALFILLGVVGLFVYEYVRIRSNNVHFTNVTSSSITVSWNTKKAIPASVRVFEGDRVIPFSIYHNNDRFFDTRDVKEAELLAVQQTSNNIIEDDDLTVSIDDFQTDIEVTDMGEYYTHHVTVTGLDPETQYSFMVGDKYLFREVKDVNGNTVVSTLQTPDEIKSPVPAYGTVKDANNQEDIAIDELSPVTDAVIYFNYLDEFTGERSSVYSSSFNTSGNWYIDVSNAVGEDGENFLDRFDTTVTNILVELTIDAGPLGQWKKIVDYPIISPTGLIVINDPLMSDDEEIGISRIDSQILDSVVKGVNAEELPCVFANFCGPCYRSSLADRCTCPEASLKARGCDGENTYSLETAASKVSTTTASGCSGSGGPGDYLKWGNSCKQCQAIKCKKNGVVDRCNDKLNPQGDVVLYKWVTINDSDGSKCGNDAADGTVIDEGTTEPEEEDVVGYIINEGRCSSITAREEEALKRSSVNIVIYKSSKSCELAKASLEQSEEEESSCPNGNCGVRETFGNCSQDCYIDLKCYNKSQGDVCDNGKICDKKGDCVEDSSEPTAEGEEPIYSDTECWKGASRGYYFIDEDGNLKRCRNNGEWKDEPSSRGSKFAEQLFEFLKSADEPTEIINAPCNKTGDFVTVAISEGEYIDYYCSDNEIWVRWEEYNENNEDIIIPAGRTEVISPGDPCDIESERGTCTCSGYGDVPSGQSCPEVVSGDCTPSDLGKTCSSDGKVCKELFSDIEKTYTSVSEAKSYYAAGETGTVCVFNNKVNQCYERLDGLNLDSVGTYIGCIPESGYRESVDYGDSKVMNEKLSSQVLGEEITTSNYVIDPKTGLISNIEQGSYLIEYQGEYYSFSVNGIHSGSSISIYLDKNGNGKYDEGGDVLVSDIASEINIVALEQRYDYELVQGLNFISLPFLISGEDYRTAAGLLTKLNEVYDDAFYSISKFDGRWKIVGQNVEIYDNNDFQLLPGEGYMIKARRDIDISIVGQPVQLETEGDKSPIYMTQGWNLIGLYGSGIKSYTAKTLIEDINKENFTADNVTKWASDKQMYEGFQLSDGEEYGFDYPLNILESYFVRITEGKGNWQPSLSGNN
jgi:hypothetical protein